MENIQKEKWSELLDRFHEDESLRARIDGGETPEVLREFGIPIPEGVEARVVEDTDDVTHVIFPSDPNQLLSDENLTAIAGGETVSSAACAGTASSFISCLGCIGCAGSVGSASA